MPRVEYVGQTVRNYWVRAKEHWDQRKQLTDVLHNALANETAPFSYVVFPLEEIDNAMHQCETWDATKQAFKPSGKILGRPPQQAVAPWFQLSRPWQTSLGLGNAKVARTAEELVPEEDDEVGRQVQTWLNRLKSEGSAALQELKCWNKDKLRETLDWIQANVPARERKANLISAETAIMDELKGRRSPPRDRHFLKLDFSHKDACHLLLRNVLRDPAIYMKHQEPEVGAAVMVSDRFRQQVAGNTQQLRQSCP